ncbi:MAG: oligosaccharide flippase family protein [Deltaproteobacteria bacterium]|nr:oligosaccharide flippase family protein [Deltaproteobacteria bacterium]MBZ0219470.1 oligosaccharide flippase family protein [Deltaproteobacteria bacterium]
MDRVFKNTFWLLLPSAFNKASSIALVIVLARHLGVAGFGLFSFAFFYIVFFSAVTEAGLTTVMIRRMRAEPQKAGDVYRKGLRLGVISTLASISAAIGGGAALGFERDALFITALASLGLVFSFRDVTFRWFLETPFRASLSMRVSAALGIASEGIGLLAVLGAVYTGAGVEAITAVYVLSNLPGFIILAVLSYRAAPGSTWEKVSYSGMLREALPIGLSNSLNTFYVMLGSVVLFLYGSIDAMGYYALAFRLTTSLRIVPEALMHSFFPLMASQSGQAGQGILSAYFRKSAGIMAFMAMPLAVGAVELSDEIAVLFGGGTFSPASKALGVLIWATAISFFNTCARSALNAGSHGARNLAVSSAMAAASAALSFALIPEWGLSGAAWSLVLAEGAGLAAYSAVLGRMGFAFPLGFISKCLLASACMSGCMTLLDGPLLKLSSGLAAYLAASALMTGTGPVRIARALSQRVTFL